MWPGHFTIAYSNECYSKLNIGLPPSFEEVKMKIVKLAALACTLPFCFASAAQAAPATISGSPALALAAVVAAHSPLLSPAEKKAVAAIFDGKGAGPYKDKIVVTADQIVCRAGNVDITARSCELTFDKKTETFAGREANELLCDRGLCRRSLGRRGGKDLRERLQAQMHARPQSHRAERRQRRGLLV
jgi:hypothetical protein